METIQAIVKPKRKLGKILLIIALSMLGFFLFCDWIWYKSGSNDWQLEREKDGIKIWTLKTPDTRITKIKVQMQVKTKLAGMIKLIEDPTSGPDVGASEVKMLEMKVSPTNDFSAYYECKINLPFPFSNRQAVILILHSQDSVSKKITMNVFAAPNRLPPNQAYVRPVHTHNIWYITPLKDDKVDIEYFQDSDIGGSVPYFVNNIIATEALYQLFVKFNSFMEMEKFKNAKYSYIKEL